MRTPNVLFLCVQNARYAGGGNAMTPVALMNDGLLDVMFENKPISGMTFPGILNQIVVKKGMHIYDKDQWEYARGHALEIENMNF